MSIKYKKTFITANALNTPPEEYGRKVET